MTKPEALSPEALCWRCEPKQFTFKSTKELEDLSEVIGQDRAIEAIRFALGMRRPEYNVYALGPRGTGKHTVVRRMLEAHAKQLEAPFDWCYVSNFKERRRPRLLKLVAGRGAVFQGDMEHFVEEVKQALRSSFESDEYRNRRLIIEEELKKRQEGAIGKIEQEGAKRAIALLRTPTGFAFAPIREGKVVAPEALQGFSQKDRKKIDLAIETLQEKLQAVLRNAPVWMKEMRDNLRALNAETATFAVGHLIEGLRERYADVPQVLAYLEDVQRDVVANVALIVGAPEKPSFDGPVEGAEEGRSLLRRYRVNLLVDNGLPVDNGLLDDKGGSVQAPIVFEDDPTYERLLGRIEQRAAMGTLFTDFNLIRPGALHRANGGYLIVDARKLLTRLAAWEGLKRALLAREARIEPLTQVQGLPSTVSLEPEPIPLDVQVVIVGEREFYYLMSRKDPEFSRLFKVAADFDEQIERNDENNLLFARLVATVARNENLRFFDRGGVARTLEISARRAGDGERLSMQIEKLADLLREADYWADREGKKLVGAAQVRRAADAQHKRLDRMRERIQEEVVRGRIVIDTEGAAIGQVNGLSVLQMGDHAFGRPSRITATVRLGRGQVLDIEREVELGGPLHSKGVLILSGFLGAHYVGEHPLSLAASLVFEQSYGGIDGDSASSAELYALLSAIAKVPIKQSLAVTGSVDQHGNVQVIGGVNEKIEGFFDLCAERGLTGAEGVLVPAPNVKNLMLHPRVVDAVEKKQFNIYPVETIDQGIELLTGLPAGERAASGSFPKGSFNRLVQERLEKFARRRRNLGGPGRSDDNP